MSMPRQQHFDFRFCRHACVSEIFYSEGPPNMHKHMGKYIQKWNICGKICVTRIQEGSPCLGLVFVCLCAIFYAFARCV
jgi:hypothetical protein